jgi:hypothetical protein
VILLIFSLTTAAVTITMRRLLLGAASLGLASAATERRAYRLLSPSEQLHRRDYSYNNEGYFPGYNPEFGSCGSGSTCADACGSEFEACPASTELSLFCFNPGAGQTCCGNGSGREYLSASIRLQRDIH